MSETNRFIEFYAINVNDMTEQKNKLTYLALRVGRGQEALSGRYLQHQAL